MAQPAFPFVFPLFSSQVSNLLPFPFWMRGADSAALSPIFSWMRESISIHWNSIPIFTHQFLNSYLLFSFITHEKNNCSMTTFLPLAQQNRSEACSQFVFQSVWEGKLRIPLSENKWKSDSFNFKWFTPLAAVP